MERQEKEYAARLKKLREAAEIGIVDINSGSFQSFDAPEQLFCHLRQLTRDAMRGHSPESDEE